MEMGNMERAMRAECVCLCVWVSVSECCCQHQIYYERSGSVGVSVRPTDDGVCEAESNKTIGEKSFPTFVLLLLLLITAYCSGKTERSATHKLM